MEREQFTQQIMQNSKGLYRVALSMLNNPNDAEDAVCEAMLSAWQYRDSLKEDSRFRPWMYRILTNTCRKMRKQRSTVCYLSELPEIAVAPEEPDSLFDVILQMDSKLGRVLILYYYEEFSQGEIAEILHIPVGTVKSRLHRGKQSLRKELEDNETKYGTAMG